MIRARSRTRSNTQQETVAFFRQRGVCVASRWVRWKSSGAICRARQTCAGVPTRNRRGNDGEGSRGPSPPVSSFPACLGRELLGLRIQRYRDRNTWSVDITPYMPLLSCTPGLPCLHTRRTAGLGRSTTAVARGMGWCFRGASTYENKQEGWPLQGAYLRLSRPPWLGFERVMCHRVTSTRRVGLVPYERLLVARAGEWRPGSTWPHCRTRPAGWVSATTSRGFRTSL